MKLIIDISEEEWLFIKAKIASEDDSYIDRAVANGTPIPGNATNGDVIKEFYPDAKYDTYFDFIAMTNHTERIVFKSRFDRGWWNAPYQSCGEKEEK